jgi:hypothetical protein
LPFKGAEFEWQRADIGDEIVLASLIADARRMLGNALLPVRAKPSNRRTPRNECLRCAKRWKVLKDRQTKEVYA